MHIAFLESEIEHADRIGQGCRELRDDRQIPTLKFRAKLETWRPIAQVDAKLSMIEGRCAMVVGEQEPSTQGPMGGDEVSDS